MQKNLDKNYLDKEHSLETKYKNKLDEGLKREIQRRFADELRKRFDSERVRLDNLYISKMKQKYHEEYEMQKKSMESKVRKRLESEIDKARIMKEKEIRDSKISLAVKIAELQSSKKQLTKEKARDADTFKEKL